jgi:hypothetical protein
VTPNAAGGYVKGSWAQLSAAITDPITSLLVCITVDDPNNDFDDYDFNTDIGIGAGGSEVVIVGDTPTHTSQNTDTHQRGHVWYPASAKAGERLAARGASSGTSADRIYDVVVVAFS